MPKIALFVMTEKGYEVAKLFASEFPNLIDRVVIGEDRGVTNDYSRQIVDLCEANEVKWVFRKDSAEIDQDKYILTVSWRWMVNHPENRLIVFHDSLLPRYRGFAPLVNMLINGETTIGVTAIFGASEYDRGDIIGQESVDIRYPIKVADAIRINHECFIRLARRIASGMEAGDVISGRKQDEDQATYSIWRDHEDYFIDWSTDANEICRFCDSVGEPYMGARTRISNSEALIIHDIVEVDDVACEVRHPGKVIYLQGERPVVICGRGLVKIIDATLESGGKQTDFFPMKKFRYRFY